MDQLLSPALREAITIIGILLNVIIGLLLYIFQQQMSRTKSDMAAQRAEIEKMKQGADTGIDRLAQIIKDHEREEKSDREKTDRALDTLRDSIAALHVQLPNEYVKQTVLASLQLELKSDLRMVFERMDELKSMMISMGAERRSKS